MLTMEEQLLEQINQTKAENSNLREQLELAEDAINYLLMGGE